MIFTGKVLQSLHVDVSTHVQSALNVAGCIHEVH